MSSVFVTLSTVAVSIVAMVFMGVLLTNNSGAYLASFTQDVLVLANNASNITNGINATQECQSALNSSNVNYDACLASGYMGCSIISAREIHIKASLSITNLTTTRDNIQWACTNRTNRLNADIAAYASNGSNTTIVQNGTMVVTVQGAAYSIPSEYVWKRTLVGGEFKLDSLVLEQWSVAPIVSGTINATITFDSFSPPVCLYQNPIPLYSPGSYFSGANVATYEGDCGSIVFRVNGAITGGVRLIANLGIFF